MYVEIVSKEVLVSVYGSEIVSESIDGVVMFPESMKEMDDLVAMIGKQFSVPEIVEREVVLPLSNRIKLGYGGVGYKVFLEDEGNRKVLVSFLGKYFDGGISVVPKEVV